MQYNVSVKERDKTVKFQFFAPCFGEAEDELKKAYPLANIKIGRVSLEKSKKVLEKESWFADFYNGEL